MALLKPLAENLAWNAEGNVSSIDLGGIVVTDDVLQSVNQLEHLEVLSFCGSQLTDDQLAQLKPHRIRSLSLAWTGVTDDGLTHLEVFDDLVLLDINNTAISDSALPQLVRLRGLQWLFIGGTKITDKGEEELRQAFPDAHIQSSTGHES